LITILSLFVLGILVGIAIMNARDDEKPLHVTNAGEHPSGLGLRGTTPIQGAALRPDKSYVRGDRLETRQLQVLENKIAELESRVIELERAATSQAEASAKPPLSGVNARDNQLNRLLTTKSLVKAGITEEIAADMVRRRNDIELRRLELRDRAARDGYLGSKRYTNELTALLAEETSLREDLGDDAYDRYLFSNGQSNRVKVTSVMLGSAAEEAGMKDGDLVLTYDQQRIFKWNELKNATGEGELGEYVNVDVSRGGQLMSLWVPRGALGVRLGSARVAP
jgi:membrane-associated protease RseP (regulator of RpoE activity)